MGRYPRTARRVVLSAGVLLTSVGIGVHPDPLIAASVKTEDLRQSVFVEAARQTLTPRQFAYLYARVGIADENFSASLDGQTLSSPKDAANWLKYIPPVSVSAGGEGFSAAIDTKSTAAFLWDIMGAQDAKDMDDRIQAFRNQSPSADTSLGYMILAAFNPTSSLDSEQRDRIQKAWAETQKDNPQLPGQFSTLSQLVGKFGFDKVEDFVRTYLAKNSTDDDIAKMVSDLTNGKAVKLDPDDVASACRKATDDGNDVLKKAMTDYLGKAEKAKIDEATEKKFQHDIRETGGIFSLASSIALVTGNAKLSGQIQKVGDGSVAIATGIHELLKKDGLRLAATANIVGAAIEIFSAFGDNQGDPFASEILRQQQVILDKLYDIQVEIAETQFQIRLVADLGRTILKELKTSTIDIRNDLSSIKRNIDQLRYTMRDDLKSLAVASPQKDFDEAAGLFNVADFRQDLSKGLMSVNAQLIYSRALTSQMSLATSVASSPPLANPGTIGADEVSNFQPGDAWTGRMPAIVAWLSDPDVLSAAAAEMYLGASLNPFERTGAEFNGTALLASLGDTAPDDYAQTPDPDAWYAGLVQYLELARVVPEKVISTKADLELISEQGIRIHRAASVLRNGAPIAYAVWRRAVVQGQEVFEREMDEAVRESTGGRIAGLKTLDELEVSYDAAQAAGLLILKRQASIDYGQRLDDKDRPFYSEWTIEYLTKNTGQVISKDDANKLPTSQIRFRVTINKGCAYSYQDVQWTEEGKKLLGTTLLQNQYGGYERYCVDDLPTAERAITADSVDLAKAALLERMRNHLLELTHSQVFHRKQAAPDSTLTAIMGAFKAKVENDVNSHIAAMLSETDPNQYLPLSDDDRELVRVRNPGVSGPELDNLYEKARRLDPFSVFKRARNTMTIADFVLRLGVYEGLGICRFGSGVLSRAVSGPLFDPTAPVATFPGTILKAEWGARAIDKRLAQVTENRRQFLYFASFDERETKNCTAGPNSLRLGLERLDAYRRVKTDLGPKTLNLLSLSVSPPMPINANR